MRAVLSWTFTKILGDANNMIDRWDDLTKFRLDEARLQCEYAYQQKNGRFASRDEILSFLRQREGETYRTTDPERAERLGRSVGQAQRSERPAARAFF